MGQPSFEKYLPDSCLFTWTFQGEVRPFVKVIPCNLKPATIVFLGAIFLEKSDLFSKVIPCNLKPATFKESNNQEMISRSST